MAGERDPDAIRVLTVQQPFAYGLIEGIKPLENRTKTIRHRGRLAIHAGLGWSLRGNPHARDHIFRHATVHDRLGVYSNGLPAPGWVRGHVIGFVDVVGCHEDQGCCDPFGERGHWHWLVDNPVRLTTPIRARGQLGLWKPDRDLREALAVAS